MNELKLKAYREKTNMSQRDVASALGITQAHYWKWEKGKSFPNAKQIIQLCEIFKCTPNDIFGFKGVYTIVGAKIDGEIS
jgi:transcriptional regulator with XRE-family HTH domain